MNHIIELENSCLKLRFRVKEDANRLQVNLESFENGITRTFWQKNLILVDSENETIVDIAEARKQ